MKKLFLVSSAIHAKHGIYTPRERFAQTVNTLKSIKTFSENSDIILIDGGVKSPSESQMNMMSEFLFDSVFFHADETIVDIQKNSNHDIVKNMIEIYMFMRVLNDEKYKQIIKSNYVRVFKLSGRYELTPNFNANNHVHPITIRPAHVSQFDPRITGGIQHQYMSRLWSFNSNLIDHIASAYSEMFEHFKVRIAAGGYADIEHLLYYHLNSALVGHVDPIGVQGKIAPNGYGVVE